MGSTPLGGCIGYFLKFLFSNFRSHIKDSKWGRKYIFTNYTCCKGSPQKSHFSLQMGNCPIPIAEDSGHSFFSNFRSNIKDSKWGRKCVFINCTSCNGSPQQVPFQFANGKLPHFHCRALWAKCWLHYYCEL